MLGWMIPRPIAGKWARQLQRINDGIHLCAPTAPRRAPRWTGAPSRKVAPGRERAGRGPLVSLAVTVWRLRDPSGRHAACVLAERDQRWQLVVQRGREMLIAERHSSDDSALARANEIWQTFRELGWTEPTH